jgi:hypothetical protein
MVAGWICRRVDVKVPVPTPCVSQAAYIAQGHVYKAWKPTIEAYTALGNLDTPKGSIYSFRPLCLPPSYAP